MIRKYTISVVQSSTIDTEQFFSLILTSTLQNFLTRFLRHFSADILLNIFTFVFCHRFANFLTLSNTAVLLNVYTNLFFYRFTVLLCNPVALLSLNILTVLPLYPLTLLLSLIQALLSLFNPAARSGDLPADVLQDGDV